MTAKTAKKPAKLMNFGQALAVLNEGKKVARAGWNGKDMWVAIHSGAANSNGLMTATYIYMRTADGAFVPWTASQTDILAEDWVGVA